MLVFLLALSTPAMADDARWDSLKFCMVAALSQPEVKPLSDDRRFRVVETLCRPQFEAAERHIAARVVEREDFQVRKLAELPAAVHRTVMQFAAQFVVGFRRTQPR